jgi:hypothetical protein
MTAENERFVMHSIISIEDLCSRLDAQMNQDTRKRVDMKTIGNNGLAVNVVGKRCLTSILVRPGGECDVDYLNEPFEKGAFKYFKFQDIATASSTVLLEIDAALKRAD